MKLPTYSGEALAEGRIRAFPEDFRVDEIPAYAPSGEGEHVFVRFEKTGLTTPDAVRRLAATFSGDAREAGTAGLKDRHAVTTQWVSFQVRETPAFDVPIDGVRVLEAVRHASKLRTGHLHGNRFRVRVRDVPRSVEAALAGRLEAIRRHGMPNFFGTQRFGREADNAARAVAFLSGRARPPKDRFERRLLVSALQSELFNREVARRVHARDLGAIRGGEVCRKEETGGMFVAKDVDVERARAERWEISPTGPMFGPDMRRAEDEAGAAEEALLAEAGLDAAALERMGRLAPGTRRVVRVRPAELDASWDDEGVVLTFVLPSGSYATVLLDELFDVHDASRRERPRAGTDEGDAIGSEGR